MRGPGGARDLDGISSANEEGTPDARAMAIEGSLKSALRLACDVTSRV